MTESSHGTAAASDGRYSVSNAADTAHAADVVHASRTSFYWAMRMQPVAKRQAMFAIYAFCREVDDIADDLGDTAGKLARLSAWRQELKDLYSGRPHQPLSRALVKPIADFGLKLADFEAIVEGMEMDAVASVRLPDQATLDIYCDRVACAVGRLSVCVFGAPDELGIRLADALGNALQRTNILRDLDEDAKRDRLYLPADMLCDAGIRDLSDANAVLQNPNLPSVCSRLAQDAQARFKLAEELLARGDRRALRPAMMMMQVYRRTLANLIARGWTSLEHRISLTPGEKLWVVVRYGLL